ncbi:MAG: hypothetical protein ACTSSN_13795, partial [Candidatus Heimdallarchaeaceae archaeon]
MIQNDLIMTFIFRFDESISIYQPILVSQLLSAILTARAIPKLTIRRITKHAITITMNFSFVVFIRHLSINFSFSIAGFGSMFPQIRHVLFFLYPIFILRLQDVQVTVLPLI